jgi:hypothetical protein
MLAAEYGCTTMFGPFPEGGFSVLVPAIPEICTFGETLEEARDGARRDPVLYGKHHPNRGANPC